MSKTFNRITNRRPALPRSAKLRNQGVTAVISGVHRAVVQQVAGGGSGSDHTHANLSALDQISTDRYGYEYLTRTVAGVEVTEKVKAGYADIAGDLTEDSPVRQQFLSKLTDDIAQGRITFEQGIAVLRQAVLRGGLQVGTYTSGLSGAGVDERGNAEFESVKIRSYLECVELIINRLSAIEGDQVLTEADTIETVEHIGYNADGQSRYRLTFRPKYDGYFTAQAEGNILKGIINTLANAVLNGGDGASASPAAFYTSWMLVEAVNAPANTCEVVLYASDQTPAGRNFAPCALMKVARWGNTIDATRQSCLYLSSTEGRIVKLVGVDKPIVDERNIGFSLGKTPEWLTAMGLPLVDGRDYLYARGVVVQDFIQCDHAGNVKVEYVERGQWTPGARYFSAERNPETGVYETSWVWHKGCKYQCIASHDAAHEPRWSSTYWEMVEGDPTFHIDFVEDEALFDIANFNTTLTVKATLHNQDISQGIEDGYITVQWTRTSTDHTGTPRVNDDNAWAVSHSSSVRQLALTAEDIGLDGGYMPASVIFTATATLRDGEGNGVQSDTVSIGY